jgi:hypothetical protein
MVGNLSSAFSRSYLYTDLYYVLVLHGDQSRCTWACCHVVKISLSFRNQLLRALKAFFTTTEERLLHSRNREEFVAWREYIMCQGMTPCFS